METVWTFSKVISLILLVIGVVLAAFLIQNNKSVSGSLEDREGRNRAIRESEEKYRKTYRWIRFFLMLGVFFHIMLSPDHMAEQIYKIVGSLLGFMPFLIAGISVLTNTKGQKLEGEEWTLLGGGAVWLIYSLARTFL